MITTALSIAAAAAALAAIAADWEERRHRSYFVLKPLTTLLLIGVAASLSLEGAYAQWVALALALSLLGDVFLMYEGDRAFVGGLASFFLAHLAFICAFASGLQAF